MILSTIDIVLQLAKEKGISQAFICGKLGLRRTYLSEVRMGKDSLPDDRLIIIADVLGTTPEYLKGETDQKEKTRTVLTDDARRKWIEEMLPMVEKLSLEKLELLKQFSETMLEQEKVEKGG